MRDVYEGLYTNQSARHTEQIKLLMEQTTTYILPKKSMIQFGDNFYKSQNALFENEKISRKRCFFALSQSKANVNTDFFIPIIKPKLLVQNPFYTYSALKNKLHHQQNQEEFNNLGSRLFGIPKFDLDLESNTSSSFIQKDNHNEKNRRHRFFRKKEPSQNKSVKSQESDILSIQNYQRFQSSGDFNDKSFHGYQLDKSSDDLKNYLKRLENNELQSNKQGSNTQNLAEKYHLQQRQKLSKAHRVQLNLPINQHNLIEQIKNISMDGKELLNMNSPEKYQLYKKRALSIRFGTNRKQVNKSVQSKSINTELYFQQKNQFQILRLRNTQPTNQ